MRKLVAIMSILVIGVSLTACGSNNSKKGNDSSTSEKASVSSKTKATESSKKTTKTSSSTSSAATNKSQNASEKLASQLNNNDWYMLAYMSRGGGSIVGMQRVADSNFLELGDTQIDSGTEASAMGMTSISDQSVSFTDQESKVTKSVSKKDLISKFIHSQTDVSSLKSLVSKCEQNFANGIQ